MQILIVIDIQFIFLIIVHTRIGQFQLLNPSNTFHPTNSLMDTLFPTIIATFDPTISNTLIDTLFPTVFRTFHPTISNTLMDTLFPTIIATFDPTISNTLIDTLFPTIFRTFYPTVTRTLNQMGSDSNINETNESFLHFLNGTFITLSSFFF